MGLTIESAKSEGAVISEPGLTDSSKIKEEKRCGKKGLWADLAPSRRFWKSKPHSEEEEKRIRFIVKQDLDRFSLQFWKEQVGMPPPSQPNKVAMTAQVIRQQGCLWVLHLTLLDQRAEGPGFSC